jgi:uncharacterized protein (DUF983 family)
MVEGNPRIPVASATEATAQEKTALNLGRRGLKSYCPLYWAGRIQLGLLTIATSHMCGKD